MDPTEDDTDAAVDNYATPADPQPPAAAAPSGDGQFGAPVPVPGSPGLYAGHPQGEGVLGLWRAPDDRDGAAPGGKLILAAGHPSADPSNVLGDYETNSWRWNDPDAIAYDLDRKQRALAEAKNLQTAAGVVGTARGGLAAARATTGIGVMAGLPAWATAKAMELYMRKVEAPQLQNKVDALQNRLNQLRGGSRT